MPRFFIGDEQGSLKSLRYKPDATADGVNAELKTIRPGNKNIGKIEALALSTDGITQKVAVASADGRAYCLAITNDQPEVVQEWSESRWTASQKYVGLAISDRGFFSCTSGGALRFMDSENDNEISPPRIASLPNGLCDWRLSQDATTFAYGGNEVDLSVWHTEQAFAPPSEDSNVPTTKKRKRRDGLLPGEIWRAKNVANDFLGLRQPVHVTSLAYLSSSPMAEQHHLAVGTQFGDVRRYDTRAARRPVANWKGVGKMEGVKLIKKGLEEHELFVADYDCNIFSIDLRTGRLMYGYKGISGTVTSMIPSPSIMASTSLDRYARIHSTFPPPPQGRSLEKRGEVLEKIYLTTIPSVIVWDQDSATNIGKPGEDAGKDSDDVDGIWDQMEDAEDDPVVSTMRT